MYMKISDIAILLVVKPYSLAHKYQSCHDIYLLQTKPSLLLKSQSHYTSHFAANDNFSFDRR